MCTFVSYVQTSLLKNQVRYAICIRCWWCIISYHCGIGLLTNFCWCNKFLHLSLFTELGSHNLPLPYVESFMILAWCIRACSGYVKKKVCYIGKKRTSIVSYFVLLASTTATIRVAITVMVGWCGCGCKAQCNTCDNWSRIFLFLFHPTSWINGASFYFIIYLFGVRNGIWCVLYVFKTRSNICTKFYTILKSPEREFYLFSVKN